MLPASGTPRVIAALLFVMLSFVGRAAAAQSSAAAADQGDSIIAAVVRGDTVVMTRRGSAGTRYEERWVFAADSSVIDATTGRTMLTAKRAREVNWLRNLRLKQRADSMRRNYPRRSKDN